MIIEYDFFKKELNKRLFENSYLNLLQKISDSPERYIGLFRPTKPKTKIIQNITQSHEIRFGSVLEYIFEEYFKKYGFEVIQNKRIKDAYNKEYNIDQLFKKNNIIYMIEQKVRDDHDSTKKIGQFDNFENKFFLLSQNYKNKIQIIPIMWFIDDSLTKNKKYYLERIETMSYDYKCTPKLYYGCELFNKTEDGIKEFNIEILREFIKHLSKWKDTLSEMPEVNFDLNARDVFEEIKDLLPCTYKKLFSNEEIIKQIFPILFPQGKVLKKLEKYFKTKEEPIFKELIKLLNEAKGIYL